MHLWLFVSLVVLYRSINVYIITLTSCQGQETIITLLHDYILFLYMKITFRIIVIDILKE